MSKFNQKYLDEAIFLASENEDIEAVEHYLKSGADVNYSYDDALQYACWHGYFTMAKFLLKKGADVNANGGQPLLSAATKGRFNIVELLLKNGAYVNYGDLNPLFLACRNGYLNVVELLLKKGSYVTDRHISEAREYGHEKIVKLLESHRAKVNGQKDVLELSRRIARLSTELSEMAGELKKGKENG